MMCCGECIFGKPETTQREESCSIAMSPFEIPPRRRSDYQGLFDDISDDFSSRGRSHSNASSTYIQAELYEDVFDELNDSNSDDSLTLYGPASFEDRIKRESQTGSYATLVFTTMVIDKKVTIHLCDLRYLPPKGISRSRAYTVTVSSTVRKCTKHSSAVKANERDSTTRINEEIRFLGSHGDKLQILVYEGTAKDKSPSRMDMLGFCEIILDTSIDVNKPHQPPQEKLYTLNLTHSLCPKPIGQILLSLSYQDANSLTVSVIKSKGMNETRLKVTLRCNGEKVKKGRTKSGGPLYNQSFKFILPEKFVENTSVLVTAMGRLKRELGYCVSGPWTTYGDGRLTHWGEMLFLKKPMLQWRYVYPV